MILRTSVSLNKILYGCGMETQCVNHIHQIIHYIRADWIFRYNM